MVADGDPGRRGTDHSESFGAQIKDGIHRRCLRRKLGASATQHKRRKVGADGTRKTWMQKPLTVSRVMQAFRDISVRERLLRDDASAPWLQRKHFLYTSGRRRRGSPRSARQQLASRATTTTLSRASQRRSSRRWRLRLRRAWTKGATMHEQAGLEPRQRARGGPMGRLARRWGSVRVAGQHWTRCRGGTCWVEVPHVG